LLRGGLVEDGDGDLVWVGEFARGVREGDRIVRRQQRQTIGPASADRLGARPDPGRWVRPGPEGEGGEVALPSRRGEPVDLGAPAGGGEGGAGVVQYGAAADEQLPAVRVGGGQVAFVVTEQAQLARGELPPPRLGVVDRRRARGAAEHGRDGGLVG